jgi:2,4-dienoyl-CoA reductase-like NADH-dependent reductase (Old Yellow Enzyme family)
MLPFSPLTTAQILQDKRADLIAVGREILNNPNWPMDAALTPGWRVRP